MLYNQEEEEVSLKICTPDPVCAAQPFSTISYSTHLYILSNKRKKNRLYFYTSVLSSFSAIQHELVDQYHMIEN